MVGLKLDTTVGVLKKAGFEAEVFFDFPNKRLRVIGYQATDFDELVLNLIESALERDLGKVWLVCTASDWINFLARGFVVEGAAEGYLKGEMGYFMSYFLKDGRQISSSYEQEQRILAEALALPREDISLDNLPSEYVLRRANKEDINQLIRLFASVFETYPVPVTDKDYLEHSMERKSVFFLIEHNGTAISVASADINRKMGNAELTDCATYKEYRGKGLMVKLIKALEEYLACEEVYCLYSLARAMSPGINKVFSRLDYKYRGRLLNNCNICGDYEDMNIWVKLLNNDFSK